MEQFGGFFEDIYKATRDENEKLRKIGHHCGFKILNGPPLASPPVLFLAYQPGGCEEDQDRYKEAEASWPEVLEYLSGEHKMWSAICELIHDPVKLERCVGINAIFFRAKSVKKWKALEPATAWKAAEDFSVAQAEKIVRKLAPKCVVVIGYGTMRRVAPESTESFSPKQNPSGRLLARQFTLWGREAVAIPHLSGARLRSGHRQEIYGYVREYLELARVWD